MNHRLLHLGNVVADVTLSVPALPERGGDVLASAAGITVGGGFNVMAAAARQGMVVRYAGAHGSGPFGDLARAALAAEGIAVVQPPRASPDTGFVVTVVDGGGERTFLTSPGAEATLTAADLAGVTPGRDETVYVTGYGLVHEANRAALLGWLDRLADGPVLVFDPGPLLRLIPEPALRRVLARTDWLTCNAREAGGLTGVTGPAAAARALSQRAGRAGVLVRTGAAGCVLASPGTAPVAVPGFPVAAVDTTGAGDAHTGVFIAALARGSGPVAAARTANAAAALAVTRRGPATAPGPPPPRAGPGWHGSCWASARRGAEPELSRICAVPAGHGGGPGSPYRSARVAPATSASAAASRVRGVPTMLACQ